MRVIRGRNAHSILPDFAEQLLRDGLKRDSRYGQVLVFPEPTTIVYEQPTERVVFWSQRDANPFFHLKEGLWMLAGRRDTKFITNIVKRMGEFSDDGKKFHAAYGYRWRKHFGVEQLTTIIEALKKNPDCRRQVLGIWDPRKDLGRVGKDLPCNLSATFQVSSHGKLDMVVHNRSNDGILGALGANTVHFSVMQEYISTGIGIPVGKYWQVSSNMHAYLTDLEKLRKLSEHGPDPYRSTIKDPYATNSVATVNIFDVPKQIWDEDLAMWMKNPYKVGLRSQFFLRVATPMWAAHQEYKKQNYEAAIDILKTQSFAAADWITASIEWLERRKANADARSR